MMNMMNMMNNIMGPLGKEYCNIFYVLGIFVLVLAILGLVSFVVQFLDKKTRSNSLASLINSVILFFIYLLYRMYYNICVKVL